MLRETACAKVNLALHVRGRRDDGYHEIESVFAFCEDGDEVTAQVRDDGAVTLSITGLFAHELSADEDNLVLRAARSVQMASGTRLGADLILNKMLPVASGVGGGSADAGATARLLNVLWQLEWTAQQLTVAGGLGRLGADIPACIASVTMMVRGTGELLEPVDIGVQAMPILLVNPLVACPTGPVFAGWDGVDHGSLDSAHWREGRNDLATSAIRLVPQIGDVLAVLNGLEDVRLARMSGSGATCFALFDTITARDRAAHAVRAAQPHWWVMESQLR